MGGLFLTDSGEAGILLWLLGIGFYMLPSIVAGFRKHKNWLAILILNGLLGVTVIGWIVALIWAVKK